MDKITKLGDLKNITLNSKEENFSTIKEKNSEVSIVLEDYYGDTIQEFLLSSNGNNIDIDDIYDEDVSTDLNDYGLKVEYKDKEFTISYLNEVLELADIDIHSDFNDSKSIRLQIKNLNIYEVLISRTETKGGKIYVMASDKEEANDIIFDDLSYYLDTLEDSDELQTVSYDEDLISVSITNINPVNKYTFVENDVIYEKGLIGGKRTEYIESKKSKIDINPNREFLLNQLQELQADFEDLSDEEIIENKDCILNRINKCLEALFESDDDNL